MPRGAGTRCSLSVSICMMTTTADVKVMSEWVAQRPPAFPCQSLVLGYIVGRFMCTIRVWPAQNLLDPPYNT